MADLSFIIEEIKVKWTRLASDAVRSVAMSNKEEVRLVRQRIIDAWFEGFNGTPFSAVKVQHVTESHSINGFAGHLTFRSWTESSEIRTFASAEKWRSREWREDPGVESNLWVSNLVFDQGIIGLPKYSSIPGYSGRGWLDGVNLHFHQKEPLSSEILSSNKWVDFMNKVEKELYEKIN